MAKNKQQKGEGNGQTVNVSFRLPVKDWELLKTACERSGRKHEEVLRELVVKWAEDVMKAEQLPPG